MRRLAALAVLSAIILGTPETGTAQDLVGFDADSFGRVVLKRTQSASAGLDPVLEARIGSYNNESIRNYSPHSVFAKLGLSVGRLDILTDNGVFPCTAFIVDDQHLLTNHHCVPGILDNERARATRIDSVMFVAGYTQQGVEEGTERFTVIPTPVETSKDLDYSVLKVIGDPSQRFGQLKLAASLPNDNDPYWVIGHPMGEAQRISREACRANAPALSNRRLLHTCDTLPGNSGSPVIDAGLQMVVGLHHAGSSHDEVNFAIPMGEILNRSEVLKAALDAPAPVEPPAPVDPVEPVDAVSVGDPVDPVAPPDGEETAGICDQMYEEAKNFGRCFAYEAYLQSCGDHAYAVFAKAFVRGECSPAVPTPVEPPEPVDTVDRGPSPSGKPLRPWCANGNLNASEAAICASPYLAGLDQEMDGAYRNQNVASAGQQANWRTGTRDACGANAACLGQAMIERIAYLRTPAAPSPAPSQDYRVVRGSYQLTNGTCYVMTASRPSIPEAIAFAKEWFPGRSGVRIFGSDNGYFGISLGAVSRGSADSRLASLKRGGTVPGDSYCSTGSRFISEVVWSGSSGGGSPAPSSYTMYVDNNSESGLNVRSGPSTSYNDFTEIKPGDKVTVLREQGDWSNVRIPDGRTGWVYSPLLTRSKPRVVQSCTARVVNLQPYSNASRSNGLGYLNIRASASTRARILSETYLGDRLQVLSQKGNWAQVRCLSGQCRSPYRGTGGATGWVSRKYISVSCR